MPPDEVRLRHMLEAARDVSSFVAGRARSDLDSDRMLLYALVRALEIIGETASKVSQPVRSTNHDIPWAQLIGMRNRIVHASSDVDTTVVWDIATRDIPTLIPLLEHAVNAGLPA